MYNVQITHLLKFCHVALEQQHVHESRRGQTNKYKQK